MVVQMLHHRVGLKLKAMDQAVELVRRFQPPMQASDEETVNQVVLDKGLCRDQAVEVWDLVVTSAEAIADLFC